MALKPDISARCKPGQCRCTPEEKRAKTVARQERYRQRNLEKVAAYQREYAAGHHDSHNEAGRAWRKTPQGRASEAVRKARRKALLQAADCGCVTPEKLLAIREAPCSYCGGTADTTDHLVSLTAGGRHCLENIVAACKPCNSRKGPMPLAEWLVKCGAPMPTPSMGCSLTT